MSGALRNLFLDLGLGVEEEEVVSSAGKVKIRISLADVNLFQMTRFKMKHFVLCRSRPAG